MKKIFIGVIVLISLVSCDPSIWMEGHYAAFYIKNSTSQTLKIDCRLRDQRNYFIDHVGVATISPGDSNLIYSYGFLLGYKIIPSFDGLYENVERITLLDALTDDTLACHLTYFNEEDWIHYKGTISSDSLYTWVFEINEEDIRQDESVNP